MAKIFFLLIFASNLVISQVQTHECAISKTQSMKKLMKSKEINYPGDDSFDATYYKLDLNVDYYTQTLSGVVQVNGKALSDNFSSFFLDLQTVFTVDSVNYLGVNTPFTHSNDKLTISLLSPLNINQEFSVEVFYHGTPGSSGFGSFEFSSNGSNPVIWTLSEPFGASDWFPCKDTPSDKVDSSDVIITADQIFYTVSNGTLVSIDDLPNNKRRFHWKNHHPIAHYLISLAMTNYAIYEQDFITTNNEIMPVIHYNYPQNLTTSRISQLQKTTSMLALFSELYGEYPYLDEKYGHAEFGWNGGMEHQTVSSMGAYGETIVAHELAHQWFGDKVTCANWENIWLNEGFATFSEAVWLGHVYGDSFYQNRIEMYMSDAKYAEGSIFVENPNSVYEIFNYNRSYAKAAVVLHMLKGIVGEEVFYEILRTYLSDSRLAYNVAVTEDFQAIAESVTGLHLNYFFSEWIYGENYPKYYVDWKHLNTANSYEYNLNITQQTNTNPRIFTMPIEIDINFFDGTDSTCIVTNSSANQNFNFIFDKAVTSISFDPRNKILKSVLSFSNLEDESLQPAKFELNQNYPNPVNAKSGENNSTIIRFSIPESKNSQLSNVKLVLYNSLGQQIDEIINKPLLSGKHEIEFNVEHLSPGVYFYQLQYLGNSLTKKLIILK